MVYPTSSFPSITLEELLANTRPTETGCLEWQGRKVKNYGAISHKGKNLAAHRIICFLAHGEPPEDGFALHSCDNPPCINPEHLRWGTHAENVLDTVIRNRRAIKRGERNGRSKLNDARVRAIRAIAGTGPTNGEIAELYGISNQMVSRIIKGEAWQHLQ